MKAYIKTALRRRLCLEYSYFDKIPPCTRVIAKQRVYGDNVFEKCGINRDGAGEVGKPRYSNGKRHF